MNIIKKQPFMVALAGSLVLTPWSAQIAMATVPGTNDLVSSSSAGTIGNGGSAQSSLSADGRYVAFASDASNLVTGDTNNTTDIFVKDRTTGAIDRVSVSSAGTQANDSSGAVHISGDGRYVVFDSWASNLVAGDTNASTDIFRYDRQTGTTVLVSQSTAGTIGNGGSNNPDISDDGRYVVFESVATNLVSGDTNNSRDIFVRDMKLNTTVRLTQNNGTEANGSSFNPTISGDGRMVAFASRATNLTAASSGNIDVMLLDRVGDVIQDLTPSANASSGDPSLSDDGSTLAFQSDASNLVSGDINAKSDMFAYIVPTAGMTRISVDSSGTQANGDSSDKPSISGDGRYIAYVSSASNLVSGDTNNARDAFLYDTQSAVTQLLSVASGGGVSNGDTNFVDISENGQVAAMMTLASNLVVGDTNANWDVIAAQTGNSASTYCSK